MTEKKHEPISAVVYEELFIGLLSTLNKLLDGCEKDLDFVEAHHLEDTKVHGFALGKEHAYTAIRKRILSDLEAAQTEADMLAEEFEGFDA